MKNGSIIPMNLNANYELGGSIGNDVDNYTNLTFRVYPQGNSSYTVNNSDGTSMEIQATENFDQHKVTVQLPAYDSQITTQIFGSRPSSVTANGNELQQVSSLDEFVAGTDCFFYNANEKFTYVKSSVKDAVAICVNGISKAPLKPNTQHLRAFQQIRITLVTMEKALLSNSLRMVMRLRSLYMRTRRPKKRSDSLFCWNGRCPKKY